MSDKNLYCSKLSSRINDLKKIQDIYEEKLETSLGYFEFRRDYEIYKDLKSDLKYKNNLYRKDCLGFGEYLISLLKS
jgi:hypothetical protein